MPWASFATIATRLPSHESILTSLIAEDVDEFVAHAANDPKLHLTQADLGRLTGRDQSTVSRLKSQYRADPDRELTDA